MPWAAWRPSAIAQTIRLWPRVMSPAVKTLETLVCAVGVGFDVAHRVEFDAELFEHPFALGAEEAHREQDEVGLKGLLASRDLDELHAAVDRLHLDFDRLQGGDAAVRADEAFGVDRVFALAAFLVRRGDAEDVRPLRPGVGGRPAFGRLGHDLELMDAGASMTVSGAEAVRAGVATADDDHMLARRRDERLVGNLITGDCADFEAAGIPSRSGCPASRGLRF